MSRKLVVKRLRSSDLSFFDSYLRQMEPPNKQKGFNLDKKVIIDELYPSLPAIVEAHPENRALVSLTLFGPGGAKAHALARKIKKEQKNWRLNGEVVHDPADQPERYKHMEADDFAVMEFNGAGAPDTVKCVLISRTNARDAAIHQAIESNLSPNSMKTVSEADLEAVIVAANPEEDHPIRDWLDRELIEDVALGGAEGSEIINTRRLGRGMTQVELQAAKANADKTGKIGEALLDEYFETGSIEGMTSYEWTSRTNAISPYDFLLEMTDGGIRHVDAKTTSSSFENPLHISLSELRHALRSGIPYDIYRIYSATENAAQMRVARNIASKLSPILGVTEGLPPGVKVDSFSISPEILGFELEVVELGGDEN